jgi:spermidine synthase
MRPPLAAIAVLSAAALAYEVLLMRLYSIVAWHHFAYMMISVALLGYGAAGTFVALARRALVARYATAFAAAAGAFGVAAVGGFLLAQEVAFNPLALAWDPREPLKLVAIYALLATPFFCVATALALSFTRFAADSPRIYAADILGAGAGSVAILAALFVVPPAAALWLVGAAGLAAAGVARVRVPATVRVPALAVAAATAVAAFTLPAGRFALQSSEYKDLSQALQIAGAHVVAERSSPLGVVTVVESPRVPFRLAPGMSLDAPQEPPPQLGVFVDGDGPSALVRYDGSLAPLAYLDYLTSAAPYHLHARPRVLVLGAGAGADVLQALAAGAASVDAVELDPQVIDLVERDFAAFSGRPYHAPGVRLHVGDARGFVTRERSQFDVIVLSLVDAFGASAAGLSALAENYLYTVEGVGACLDRLGDGGVLAITRWVNLPPRDVLRLVATAAAALERRGVAEPARHFALLRSWRTATLLVKNAAFTEEEIRALVAFARERSFDADYYPGIRAEDANRYNVLDASYFHDGAEALLGPGRDDFIARYKYELSPATDDRPHFFHFFRWRTLPELLARKGRGGLPLIEWGYPVLVATLVQAVLASLVLIVLPLALAQRGATGDGRPSRVALAGYFTALGLAFMFVEIAFIQKFVLFLAHPLYAVAVVLASFLVSAGLGSVAVPRLLAFPRFAARPLAWLAAAIVAIALAYAAALPLAFRALASLPDVARVAVAIALIVPLGFAMGMPFPLGLTRLARRAEALVPWAFAVNGCASVIAAVLATLIAIHAGFTVVIALAAALYALAAALFPALGPPVAAARAG